MQRLEAALVRAKFNPSAIAVAALVACFGLALPAGAVPPAVGTAPKGLVQPNVKDLGLAAPGTVKKFALNLSMRNASTVNAVLASMADPKSANYRQYLTPAQFAAQFGQTDAAVASTIAFLQSKGATNLQVQANKLLVTGNATNAQLAAVFGSPIHSYTQNGVAYEAPSGTVSIPSALSGVVASVAGLNTKPVMAPRMRSVPSTGPLAGDYSITPVKPKAGAIATGVPGSYTVGDLAAKYNINPLYAKGLSGAGKTIGIVTLAGYDANDVYGYWGAINLPVLANRLTNVLVDGGPAVTDGPGSDGSGETTLDIEQAGGVAPNAKIRVYLGPNDNSGLGYLDAFSVAVNENLIDSLSTSWGSVEAFGDPAVLNAMHAIFIQAALQGIPVIAASGDRGLR